MQTRWIYQVNHLWSQHEKTRALPHHFHKRQRFCKNAVGHKKRPSEGDHRLFSWGLASVWDCFGLPDQASAKQRRCAVDNSGANQKISLPLNNVKETPCITFIGYLHSQLGYWRAWWSSSPCQVKRSRAAHQAGSHSVRRRLYWPCCGGVINLFLQKTTLFWPC